MGYISRTVKGTPNIHPIARERLQPCRTIVDIGCGIGRLGPVLPGARLIGVDVSPDASVCLQRGYAEFYRLDVEKEYLPSLQATGMVCSHVLEHFLRPEQALIHTLTSLQPGALLFAVCPTLHNAKYWDDYTHVRPFTENSLRGLLEDAGLCDVELLYELQAPFRGAGRLLSIWTHGDRARAALLAKRFPWLRAPANVQALATYPGRGIEES